LLLRCRSREKCALLITRRTTFAVIDKQATACKPLAAGAQRAYV
jgi:hypothetical protein